MQYETITHENLYKMVWSEPMITLSKRYNISDVGLKKICVRMSIPVPDAGHWAKQRAGKTLFTKPLPDNYTGDKTVRLHLRTEHSNQTQITINSELIERQNEIKNDKRIKLEVPNRLSSPDVLILAASEVLKSQKYEHDGLVSGNRDTLDIRVSKENISRALRIMDTLIKALKIRGHKIEVGNGETFVKIGNEKIEIRLKEKLKRHQIQNPKHSWERTELRPTGILTFKMKKYWRESEWLDNEKQPLEELLFKIIAKIELEGKRLQEETEQRRIAEEKRREAERIQQELERRQEAELSDFKDLFKLASRLEKAEYLRRFINAVENNAIQSGTLNEKLSNWLQWARDKADWYDPLTSKEDELLKDVNKDDLTLPKRNAYRW